MFRIARNSDFCRLVSSQTNDQFTEDDLSLLSEKYPGETMPEGMQWGLKQIGYLHALDQLKNKSVQSLIEVGPGFNHYFPNHLPAHINYTSLDSKGFYEARMLELMAQKLTRGRTIDGLLGDFSVDVPSDSFDMCVSVSVLEHVPYDRVPATCSDMWRILKPGGWAVHSIDLQAPAIGKAGLRWRDELLNASFLIDCKPSDIDLSDGDWLQDPPHAEPLSIVMRFYSGYKDSIWKATLPSHPTPNTHTILVAAQKPYVINS